MNGEKLINLNELNNVQREAVENIKGASLIIAGAGSGKTRVLIYKIAYLLENGFPPSSILALTFTNHAAKEMKNRIVDLVGKDRSRGLLMGTFHSLFLRFLREYAELIGFSPSFTIYDTSDTRNAIKACIKELELDDNIYKPAEVQSRISKAKNNLVTAESYMNNQAAIQNDMLSKRGRICDIYKLYSVKCKKSGVMDFDDILLYMNILLRDNPGVADEIGERFKYILVDEYQDTNLSQYLIVKKISAINKNISVVGDDSQSIYGFRGARIQNILNFRKDFEGAKEYRLEQNYRSTQTIVNAANSVINNNKNRIKKQCFSEGDTGEKIEVIKAHTEQEEAMLVASSIMGRIHGDRVAYKDFAVLYRTNAQSRVIEEMLRRRNLPYKLYVGHSFYERAEVKNMLAYFKLLINKHDDEAFKRIINFPARGIGNTSLLHLFTAAKAHNSSLWDAIFLENIQDFGLKPAAINKLKNFIRFFENFKAKLDTLDAYEIGYEIAKASGVIAFFENDNTIESKSRLENVEELLNGIKSHVEEKQKEEMEVGNDAAFISLSNYIENVSLLTDMDVTSEEDENRISLMTVHASKGLEMPYIYIIGMEENLFPSMTSMSSEDEVEEERRLFYVALTRASKCAAISFSSSRFRWGKHVSYSPSRFVKEIDPKFLSKPIKDEVPTERPVDECKKSSNFRSLYPSNNKPIERVIVPPLPKTSPKHRVNPNFQPGDVSNMKVGDRVEHDRFGKGEVLKLELMGADIKAIIKFDDDEERALLLKFAKLRIIK